MKVADMGISHGGAEFQILHEAFKVAKQVEFYYTDSNGTICFRRGFVVGLTDKAVDLLDVLANGPRKCLFARIYKPKLKFCSM